MTLIDAGRLAVGTLTVVPVPPPVTVDGPRAGLAMTVAPLAVLPLGAATTVTLLGGSALQLPVAVVGLLGLAVAIAGNRGFHLDGLSDTVDGLAASYERERSLAVMRSGTAGPAGVVAVVLVLGLQAAGIAALVGRSPGWRGALLAGVVVCVSRAALAICCARGVPAARPEGLGHTCAGTVARPVALLVWCGCAAVVAAVGAWTGLPWWRGVLAVVLAALMAAGVVSRAVRRLGGVTGDVFGASIELTLATLLVALS